MKKSLIALAVASAVSAPAFAATANVDVYGVMNVAVSYFDDQPSTINDVQVSTFGSRIGFKGAEDLGGGLKAIWQIESSINFEEQTGTLAGRNSFVGLSGGFGSFLLGNHDTPLKSVGRAVDLFGDTIGDSRNVMGGGSDTRAKNVAVYMSPDMGGFGIAAAYSTDLGAGTIVAPSTVAADSDDRGVYNLSATYKNGPLFLGLGYGDGDGHEALGLGAHMRAAAGFTMGALKFVGQYDKLEGDTVGVYTKGDYDAWMAGVAYTMGAFTLKGNYMDGDFDNAADRKQWNIGGDYAMSKRTKVYAVYTDGENVTLGGGAGSSDQIGPGVTHGDINGVSLGMVHTF